MMMSSEELARSASSNTAGPDDIEAKLRRFQQQREQDAQHKFASVSMAASRAGGTGLMLYGVGIVVKAAVSPVVGHAVQAPALLLASSGVALMCSLPLEKLDVDGGFMRSPKTHFVVSLAILAASASNAMEFPHLHASAMPLSLALLLNKFLPGGCGGALRRGTVLISGFLWCLMMGDVAYELAAEQRQAHLPLELRLLLATPSTCGCLSIFIFVTLAARRAAAERWTNLLVNSLQAYCVSYALWCLLGGSVLYIQKAASSIIFAAWLLSGVCVMVPLAVVWTIGKDRLFLAAHRWFDRSMATKDGAVVAALLESTGVKVGSAWWVHRPEGEQDVSFPEHDHRRNWKEGLVVGMGPIEFQVELPLGEPSTRRLSFLGHGHNTQVTSVPLPTAMDDPQQLAQRMRQELRCMHWSDLTEDLMSSNESNPSHLARSRSVSTAEAIDYFLTHSWHDNALEKLQVLKVFADELAQRPATLWLDKTCIDQSRIRDGLSVLPVIVMSCKRLLCLWGPSYPSRLWCVWELFTLIAFGSTDSAASKLVVVPLPSQETSAGILLQSFDVRCARCYDPNEQARLLEVIGALGLDRFNQRIQELGAKLEGKALASPSLAVRSWRAAFGRTAASNSRGLGRTASAGSQGHGSPSTSTTDRANARGNDEAIAAEHVQLVITDEDGVEWRSI